MKLLVAQHNNLVFAHETHDTLEALRDNWTKLDADSLVLDKSSRIYLDRLRLNMQLCHDAANAKCDKTKQAYVDTYNKKSTPTTYNIGDQVLILLADSTNKLRARWTGPAVIHEVKGKDSYLIKTSDGAVRQLHANHLRVYHVPVINSVGIIYDDDKECFGDIVCCGTPLQLGPDLRPELTTEKIKLN